MGSLQRSQDSLAGFTGGASRHGTEGKGKEKDGEKERERSEQKGMRMSRLKPLFLKFLGPPPF